MYIFTIFMKIIYTISKSFINFYVLTLYKIIKFYENLITTVILNLHKNIQSLPIISITINFLS